MYADRITEAMQQAIDETNRRRAKQMAYNREHGIEPVSIVKAVHDLTERLSTAAVAEGRAEYTAGRAAHRAASTRELRHLIAELEQQMKTAAKNLEFEKAAVLRDQIFELRALLAEESNLPPWQKARLLAGEEAP